MNHDFTNEELPGVITIFELVLASFGVSKGRYVSGRSLL